MNELTPTQRVEQVINTTLGYPAEAQAMRPLALQLATELEAAQKQLEIKQLLPFHGCFSGDCPHDNSNQCVEALKQYVSEMEFSEHKYQDLRQQLADKTRECDEKHCPDCCCGASWKALGISENTGKSIPDHINQLRAENVELKQDKERLDWLEKVSTNSMEYFQGCSKPQWRYGFNDSLPWHESLRTAIDAARKEQK